MPAKEKMEAFGLNINSIVGNTKGVSGKAGETLFGNEVGTGASNGEFASLMDILGQNQSTKSTSLLEMLNSAKENPEALGKLPKEVLQFIGQEFQFDGKNIINQEGGAIQVEDIISKIKELKPELLNTKMADPQVAMSNKEAEAIEVRNLLKSHDLGFDKTGMKSKTLFSSGNDFVQVKESVQPMIVTGEAGKAAAPKKMNGLNQYTKESKTLYMSMISANNVEMPEAAVGMTQFKSGEADLGQLAPQAKVVDLSNIQAGDKTSLIDQVTKIIEQNNIKSADSMDVTVKHDQLGQFKIEVSKNADTNQLDLRIISKEKMGHNFFVENEAQLSKTLNQSGIKLSSFKIAMSSEKLFSSNAEGGSKDFSEGNFSQNRGQQGQYGGRDSENSDSQRRRQLWQAFRENAEYASA